MGEKKIRIGSLEPCSVPKCGLCGQFLTNTSSKLDESLFWQTKVWFCDTLPHSFLSGHISCLIQAQHINMASGIVAAVFSVVEMCKAVPEWRTKMRQCERKAKGWNWPCIRKVLSSWSVATGFISVRRFINRPTTRGALLKPRILLEVIKEIHDSYSNDTSAYSWLSR